MLLQFNRGLSPFSLSQAQRDRAREEYATQPGIDSAKRLVTLEGADQRSDDLLAAFHKNPDSLSRADKIELSAYLQVYGYEQALKYGPEAAEASIQMLLRDGPVPVSDYHYAGMDDVKNAYADAARAQVGGFWDQLGWSRPKTENELIYKDAQGMLRINNEQQGLSNLGSPALYGLTGPLGAGIRIAAAANGVLQAAYGANQAFNGDLWNAAGNIVVGALGVASVKVPSTRLPNASGIGEFPVTNPNPGSTLVKEAGEVFDWTTVGAKATATIGGQAASTLSKNFGESVLGHNTQIGVRNSKAGTISGAHNSDAFLESVEITGAKISNKITDVRYPGLVEYSYQLPRTNTKGELMGGYKPTSTKTTYDPKVLPDSKVADMSSRAAIQAESLFKANPALREASIKVDGYHFQVTRNSKTGEITNSFITMPPRTN